LPCISYWSLREPLAHSVTNLVYLQYKHVSYLPEQVCFFPVLVLKTPMRPKGLHVRFYPNKQIYLSDLHHLTINFCVAKRKVAHCFTQERWHRMTVRGELTDRENENRQ